MIVKGQKREALGKKDAKKLRSQELVPAVLYGTDEVIHFAVPSSELRNLVYTPSVYFVDLDIDGDKHLALIQDMQWHAVEEQILHIDFLKIQEDKPVKIDVPVKIIGMAKGIKAGGKLKINLRRLKVKALAAHIPDTIDINVTKLGLAQSIKVADLKMDNIEFLDNKSNVVVTVAITRAARSAAGAAAPEEEEEEETSGEE